MNTGIAGLKSCMHFSVSQTHGRSKITHEVKFDFMIFWGCIYWNILPNYVQYSVKFFTCRENQIKDVYTTAWLKNCLHFTYSPASMTLFNAQFCFSYELLYYCSQNNATSSSGQMYGQIGLYCRVVQVEFWHCFIDYSYFSLNCQLMLLRITSK